MAVRAKNYQSGKPLQFFDDGSQETIQAIAPVVFYDDFLGTDGLKAATAGAVWTAKDIGGATEAVVANAPSGVVALTLAVTSEEEEAGLTFGDKLDFIPGQGLVFETRAKVSVLPTLASDMEWGFGSAYIKDCDNVAQNAWFKVDGSGAVVCESDDATPDTDDAASG